jgi:hypothetical protein
MRSFASSRNKGKMEKSLGNNFSFPRHKELFNDEYYASDNENTENGYMNDGNKDINKNEDTVDPNSPFTRDNLFTSGGILSQYRKRVGLTAEDVMEKDYWENVRNIKSDAS